MHTVFNPPEALGLFISSGTFAWAVGLLCRLRRIPYVVIAGGWGIPLGRTQRAYFKNASRVLVHTSRHRDWLIEERGCDPHNIEVFPVGVDPQRFSCKRLSVQPLVETVPRLLYVGRLVPSKGAFEAVEAFAEVKKVFPAAEMSLVGPLLDVEFGARIQSFLNQRGLGDSVTFEGTIPRNELPSWYQAATLLLFPSQSESFGMVIVESMACGTPVIAMRDSGGPDEIIAHGKDGMLVQPGGIGKAATALLHDPERIIEMGRAARNKVEEKYKAERTYKQLSGILTYAAERT